MLPISLNYRSSIPPRSRRRAAERGMKARYVITVETKGQSRRLKPTVNYLFGG